MATKMADVGLQITDVKEQQHQFVQNNSSKNVELTTSIDTLKTQKETLEKSSVVLVTKLERIESALKELEKKVMIN